MFEARTIIRHAGTVLVGQLAVMAFGVADTLIAGRYDAERMQGKLACRRALQAELGLSDAAVAQQVRSYRAAIEHEKSVLMGDDS